MSIYCTSFELDEDGEHGMGGQAPLIYLKSHVLPTLRDPRGGSFDLATIPPWIKDGDGKCLAGKVCDGAAGCCESHDEFVNWPFLRVSVRPDSHPSMAEYETLINEVARFAEEANLHGHGAELAALVRKVADPEDTVVLDRSQVEKLRDHLTDWLGRTQ
jgi:hypothetical protein